MRSDLYDKIRELVDDICGDSQLVTATAIEIANLAHDYYVSEDGIKCDPDKCPDACDKEPSEENSVVRHDHNEISIKDGDRMFSSHVYDALKHVNAEDEESLEFIHNSINMAASIFIEAPVHRSYESEKVVDVSHLWDRKL